MQNIEQNTLQLENRKKLIMNGVVSVDSFSPTQLRLSLESNSLLISGENLKVINFNKAQGNLVVDGLVNEIKFLNKKTTSIKRFFK